MPWYVSGAAIVVVVLILALAGVIVFMVRDMRKQHKKYQMLTGEDNPLGPGHD